MANTVPLDTLGSLRCGFVIVIVVALVHSAILVLTIFLIVGLGDTDTAVVNGIESVHFVVSAILRFPLLWIPAAAQIGEGPFRAHFVAPRTPLEARRNLRIQSGPETCFAETKNRGCH